MDRNTLLAGLNFGRAKLLGILDAIEHSGQDVATALAWRPGPGRAHIGWQAMHCATTHDKYVNINFKGGRPLDAERVEAFGGGSVPSDQNVPTLPAIRSALKQTYEGLREYVASADAVEMQRKLASGRTVAESILLLTWHEAHHQGQIHLTWNLYKQAHGIK